MKNLAKQDVKDAAVKLMQSNGSTTTLDVKNELRSQGFWATQNQVSDFMNDLHNEESDWVFDNPNGFRVYRIDASGVSTNDNDTSQSQGASGEAAYVNAAGNKIEAVDSNQTKSDDWECYTPMDATKIMFFPGTFSRDEVRCAFRFYTGLHFNDTRARRLV